MTDEQVAEEELNMPQDDLVKVEGTKITLGKAFLDQYVILDHCTISIFYKQLLVYLKVSE